MATSFELSKSSDGQYRFVLKGAAGESLLNSELYKEKASARNGIASVQSNCGNDNRYDKKASSNGKHYFNLKANNGQIIGTSPMFASEADRDAAIASVKVGAAAAEVKDNT
ncbi:MAG: YegP family protein [Lautropia sp.]|nr:YegP family protein [Lautropia sp.]